MDEEKEFEPTRQLHNELRNIIVRYGEESEITMYQVIATLEILKHDLIEKAVKREQP